jgi:tRNA-dihydrouridine synthase
MAGITHSAFRRLVSDFGGYGALYTEMLSPGALLKENLNESPFTKRRAREGLVIYQMQLNGDEPLEQVINRLRSLEPAGIDINLGCPAPAIRKNGAGKALFDNFEKVENTLRFIRKYWHGLLSIKCRLGDNCSGWEEKFLQRLRLFEDCDIDMICVHPRFSDEKLKRFARWDLFKWIRSQTKIPLIGNGDITEKTDLTFIDTCDAFMVGRASVTKPWIFQCLNGQKPNIDLKEVWMRFYSYTCEDFPPEKAIGRIKEFTIYYSKNFFFGHELFRAVQPSPNLDMLKKELSISLIHKNILFPEIIITYLLLPFFHKFFNHLRQCLPICLFQLKHCIL